jgi:hypothetical protein
MIDPVIAEILKCQGALEAKVEMLEAKVADLMGEEAGEMESEPESEGPEPALATNPAIYSNQLEFDIPPIF